MNNNNQPPFEVICIDDWNYTKNKKMFHIKIGQLYKAIGEKNIDGTDCYEIAGWPPTKSFGKELDSCYYAKNKFKRIPPAYSDISKELAQKAMEVGDKADQPVKEIVNN